MSQIQPLIVNFCSHICTMNNDNDRNIVLEFAQVCWVVPDIHATIDHLSNSLGISFPKPALVRAQDVKMTYYGKMIPSECLTSQTHNGVFIELVQPISGKSMFSDYLERFPQGGVQHNAFRLPVDGFERIKKSYRDKGFEIISECDHPIA